MSYNKEDELFRADFLDPPLVEGEEVVCVEGWYFEQGETYKVEKVHNGIVWVCNTPVKYSRFVRKAALEEGLYY